MTARWLRSLVPVAVLALAIPGTASGAVAQDSGGDPPDGKGAFLSGEELGELPGAATSSLGPAECSDGMAGPFPCENVDLESVVSLAELGGGNGNDIWGWTDPQTGREYALMGTSNGTAFVDVSEPQDPVVVGQLPTQSVAGFPLWRDIKVFDDHAFVVSEHDDHGMQVFDLTRLRDARTPTVFTPDAVYEEFESAHNVAVNPDSGFAYAVGTETCDGGLHMVDIGDPQDPSFAGCFSEDGYTHDVQCVNYHGQDGRFHGHEICFAANEDTVTIVDVTDKANPTMLSRTTYPTAAYTHQGWLTPDHRWFLFNDEADETSGTVETTTTYIMRIKKLTEPAKPVPYAHETPSIDHNLYLDQQHVYESNYTAGLRILDYTKQSLKAGELDEVGFFDVFPANDEPQFLGTWSNYPFFDSGIVVVSSIDSGLFVLRPQIEEGG